MRVATSLLVGTVVAIGLVAGQLVRAQGPRPAPFSRAAATRLAPTPPMGWNSWDSYGLRIDEQQFRSNVSAMADKLKPSGTPTPSSTRAGTW